MVGTELSATISKAGPHQKVYPVHKIAAAVNALATEGVSSADALDHVQVSESEISSPATRVSLSQIIECYHNAIRFSRDPRLAYHIGLTFHISTYGMYGFAMLSSTNFRQTMRFAAQYHQLGTPTAEISFKEEGDHGVWTIVPVPHPRVDAPLYRFLVELQFGVHVSLHRDVMGASFVPETLHVTYPPPFDAQLYPEAFGCQMLFGQAENKLVFDAARLDVAPKLGNEITHSVVVKLCDDLLEELQLDSGLSGKVREALLVNLARPARLDAIARYLNMTPRTLRRTLREEDTSFGKLLDELRMQVAIKYLRDTQLTTDDIADVLGFSDAANFRRAFRRWTNGAPHEFRRISTAS